MDELMPELVGLILSHVDRPSLIGCRFVCTTWMHITSPPPPRQDITHHHQHDEDDDEEDWSKQFAAMGCLGAPVGAGQRLSLGRVDV
jgi:hypothetical protein